MRIRKSSIWFVLLGVAGLVLAHLFFIHPASREADYQRELRERGRLVRELSLTDLCLFTEARYTRHPSLSDWHAPFQDHPISLEHFPSGSLVLPPTQLKRTEHVD